MNVLFLDFDGVINTPVGIDENGNIIDDYNSPADGKVNNFVAVKLIERLCDEEDLKIVVSSKGWRNYLERNPDGSVRYKPYKTYLVNSGMREELVLGHTPFFSNTGKTEEIDAYLSENKVDRYIVIDDTDNGGEPELNKFKGHLILCDGDRGFTEENYKIAKKLLERQKEVER